MDIKPLGDRVLVKILPKEGATKSGIILPETVNKELRQEGQLTSLGNGEELQKLNLQIGQKVLFAEYKGENFKMYDPDTKINQEYKILNYDDLLAVIE